MATHDATSWSELEASKVRVVSILDRVEYLKHLQYGLADLSNKHADELQASCNQSRSHMWKSLRCNAPKIERMLEDQRNLMREGGTATKRLNKLHSFVVTKEKRLGGQMGAEAARMSAASFDAGLQLGAYTAPVVPKQAAVRQTGAAAERVAGVVASAEGEEGEGDSALPGRGDTANAEVDC